MKSRKELRRVLRTARRDMVARGRRRAEALITARLLRLPAYRRARSVAVYVAFDGEVDLRDTIVHATRSGKIVYLPAVGRRRDRVMQFLRFNPGTRLRGNRFGIGEAVPTAGNRTLPGRIGLVLVPVVGFDQTGTRLGMGGGFYDRCFAALARRTSFRKRLVGVAFECQKVDWIERMAWDVPMSAVVTERRVYRGGERRHDMESASEDR